MIKVAIFGDSYAESTHKENPTPSWFDYLSPHFDVKNFGVRGSGVYYSYDLFLKNHEKFDKIIFLQSTPGRVMIPSNIVIEEDLYWARHIPNLHVALINGKSDKLINLKKQFNAAVQYFQYLFDEQKEQVIDELMIDHIRRLRPDAIILKTHHDDIKEFTLWQVTVKQFEGWQKNLWISNLYNKYSEILNNHLTPENNKILGEKILEMLQGKNIQLSVEDFLYPTEPFEKYFIERK